MTKMMKASTRSMLRNPWLIRYVLSLFAVALLPMLIVMVMYINRLDQTVKEEMLNVYRRNIMTVQERQNSVWDSISSVTMTLNNNAQVLDYIRGDYRPTAANTVRGIFSSILAAHPYLDEIFLFCPDEDVPIVSSRYIFYTNRTNTSPKLDNRSVLDIFDQIDDNGIISSTYLDLNYGQNPSPYPIVLYRISGFYRRFNPNEFSLVFSVRTDQLAEYDDLREADRYGQRGVALIGYGNNMLSLSQQDPAWLQQILAGKKFPQEQGNCTLNTEHGHYEMLWAANNSSPFRAVLFMPLDEIMAPLDQEMSRLVGVFFVLAVLAVLLLIFLLFRSYSPIHDLEQACISIRESAKEQESIDDKTPFETIDTTLQMLKSQVESLNSVISKNQSAVRNSLLLTLFSGEAPAEIERSLTRSNISFPHDTFTLLYTTSDSIHYPPIQLKEDITRFFAHRRFSCYAASGLGNWCALLVNHPLGQKDKLLACVNDFQNRIMDEHQTEIIIGLSSASCGIRDLPTLYTKAKLAHEYYFLLNASLIDYANIEQYLDAALPQNLYAREREALAGCIYSGNLEQTVARLQHISQYLHQYTSGIMEIRYLCYNLAFFVVETLNNHAGVSKYSINFDELRQLRTIDDLVERLTKLCTAELSKDDDAYRKYPAIDEINQYIAAHYHDQLFSISRLAEKYAMSGSAFSQYYKKKTGETISEYLMRCRIEQAMRLLSTTELPIGQIVNEIGYYSASSFIKKFKSYTGKTPGEYRTQQKKKRS